MTFHSTRRSLNSSWLETLTAHIANLSFKDRQEGYDRWANGFMANLYAIVLILD